MDPTLKIILRIIHVLVGVYWAGGTFLMVSVIAPAAAESGPEGGKVMLNVGPRFRNSVIVMGTLTLLSGIILYIYTSGFVGGGLTNVSAWLGSLTGLLLSIGALGGLVAFIYGAAVTGPASEKLGEVGKKIAAAGGPPTPELGAQLAAAQSAVTTSTRIVAILFVIVIIGMAGAGV